MGAKARLDDQRLFEEGRALANDNGGTWWVARSAYQVERLEKLFIEDRVATVLCEVTGGLLETGRPGFIYVQLARSGWDVDVALEDLRVTLLEEVGHWRVR